MGSFWCSGSRSVAVQSWVRIGGAAGGNHAVNLALAYARREGVVNGLAKPQSTEAMSVAAY